MRITKKSILSFVFLISLILPVSIGSFQVNRAYANQDLLDNQEGLSEVRTVFGGSLSEEDPRIYMVNMINLALGFLSVILLGILVAAGFMYMTAGGNQEKTSKAVALIKNAVIGLVIVIAAWSIARFTIYMIHRASRDADTSTYVPGSM